MYDFLEEATVYIITLHLSLTVNLYIAYLSNKTWSTGEIVFQYIKMYNWNSE